MAILMGEEGQLQISIPPFKIDHTNVNIGHMVF